MNFTNILKQSSLFLFLPLLTACGGESAKEAKVGEEKEKAQADKGSTTYELNKEKSALQWTGRKQSGKHDGTVDLKKGSLKAKGGSLQAGSFVVDMTTIHVTDDMDSSHFNKLMGHLRSEDFFNVDSFPTSKFELTGVKPYEGDSAMKIGLDTMKKKASHTIQGNLTIKGITKNVSEIPAWIKVGDGKVKALTEFSFDRTRWDIKYKSKSVLDNLKDGFIYDKVDLRISLQADKAKKMAKSGKEGDQKNS